MAIQVAIGQRDGEDAEGIQNALEAAQAAQAATEEARDETLAAVEVVQPILDDLTAINTVATNIGSVNTVAGISGNVTTVAGIAANVTTVAGSVANINLVAGSIANVNLVAGDLTNIGIVAGISADVTTVAGLADEIAAFPGEVADAVVTLNNAAVAAGAEITDNAEVVVAIAQAIEEYSKTCLIGVPVPITGTAANNSTFTYGQATEEAYEVIEFGFFGINGNGTDVVFLQTQSYDADEDELTTLTETSFDSTSGVLNVMTAGNGLDVSITGEAGEYFATYSHSTTARIGFVANGAPALPYWETSGHQNGTYARGTFVSNRVMQLYVKVRYASGRIATLLDPMRAQVEYPLIYGKHSGETLATGTGTPSDSSTALYVDPRPFPRPGPIDGWDAAVDTPGGAATTAPMLHGLVEVGADGNSVDVYGITRSIVTHGENYLRVSDGTLPQLEVRSARRVFPWYMAQTNGAQIRTTTGSNNVPSAGYGLTITVSGDIAGANTFNHTTTNVRFDHRIHMRAQRADVPNKIIHERTFGGSVWPWDVRGQSSHLSFTSTGIQLTGGNLGIGNGCRGVVEEALNHSRVKFRVVLGAYDAPFIGKRLTLGNYGTIVIADVATNTLSVHPLSGNTLGSAMASKVAPFSTDMAEGNVLEVEGVRADRTMHLTVVRIDGGLFEQAQFAAGDIVPNLASGAKHVDDIEDDTVAAGTTLTFDLDAWFDESDLARMGQWQGAWCFGSNRANDTTWATTTGYVVGNFVTESGSFYYCREDHTSGTFATDLAAGKWGLWSSSELQYQLHDSEALDATGIMVVDSMGESRAPFSGSWFGTLRTKVEDTGGKFVLNAIHGTTTTGHRISTNRLMDYMDRLDWLLYAGGMNDTTPSNPVATSSAQANFTIYQAYDRGIAPIICDVFLTFIPAPGGIPDPANNDGNIELTGELRATATALGAVNITFKDTDSINGEGLLRLESWHPNSTDAHLYRDTGHKQAAKQTAMQAGHVMGINHAGITSLMVYTP